MKDKNNLPTEYDLFIEIRSNFEMKAYNTSNIIDSNLIALSMFGIITNIFSLGIMNNHILLFIGLLFFSATILVTMYSYQISEDCLRDTIYSLDLDYQNEDTTNIDLKISKGSKVLDYLRYIGGIFFIIGVILLLYSTYNTL